MRWIKEQAAAKTDSVNAKPPTVHELCPFGPWCWDQHVPVPCLDESPRFSPLSKFLLRVIENFKKVQKCKKGKRGAATKDTGLEVPPAVPATTSGESLPVAAAAVLIQVH